MPNQLGGSLTRACLPVRPAMRPRWARGSVPRGRRADRRANRVRRRPTATPPCVRRRRLEPVGRRRLWCHRRRCDGRGSDVHRTLRRWCVAPRQDARGAPVADRHARWGDGWRSDRGTATATPAAGDGDGASGRGDCGRSGHQGDAGHRTVGPAGRDRWLRHRRVGHDRRSAGGAGACLDFGAVRIEWAVRSAPSDGSRPVASFARLGPKESPLRRQPPSSSRPRSPLRPSPSRESRTS